MGKVLRFDTSEFTDLRRVRWAAQQYKRRRFMRLPKDPLFPDQWHLNNTDQIVGAPGIEPRKF